MAMFNASADLLEHLGLDYHSRVIREAIDKAINVAKVHTADLGGNATTKDVVNFIMQEVKDETQQTTAYKDVEYN